METFASHSDGSAATEGTAGPVRLPAARAVRQSGQGWLWISPDGAAAWADGRDDWVPHVPEGEVSTHAAPALEAHTHRHWGGQGAPWHSAGDAGGRAPVGGDKQVT